MAKTDNQKLKILYILDYLQKNSHQDKPVRANELISMLDRLGISCDRKTIYSDIAALQEFGVDIEHLPGRKRTHPAASAGRPARCIGCTAFQSAPGIFSPSGIG